MFDRLKKTIGFLRRSVSPAWAFAILMAISFAVYAIFYSVYGRASFVDVFFSRCGDLFMDFFNSVRDASQGVGVYTERHVIYPPMANLIYLICSRFIPEVYNQTDWYSRLTWTKYPEAVFFIVLFTLALTFIFYTVVYESVKGSRKMRFAFAVFAVFNIPVLYMLERGNMIMFCFISVLIYAFTYNSSNKVYREIGLIVLAFSFSLKLYPVIFGWFLLVDKRYKDALRCAFYGLLMLVIPSFFFGGPACFVEIYKNIRFFSTETINSISVISGYSGIPASVWSVAAYLWCLICVVCFVISPFIYRDEKWRCWMLGIVAILTVPSLTNLYLWSFLLVPIIMLSNSGKVKKKDWFFFAVMAGLFVFTLFRFNSYLTINSFLLYPFTAVLSVTAVTDTIVSGVRGYKLRRSVSEA